MGRTPLFRTFVRILRKAQSENLGSVESSLSPLPPRAAKRASLSRRRFIKSAALAGSSALLAGTIPQVQQAWSRSTPQIAIVGGGLAGLNAAYQLQKVNVRATIYEARNRLGGRILSSKGLVSRDLVTNLGGSFINTNHEDVLSLVDEFGLTLFDRPQDAARFPFPDTAFYFDGRLRPEAEVAAKLGPLAAQIFEDAALLDEDFDQFVLQFDSLSVADYLDLHQDKIPESFIRTLIENTIRTEYGVEPADSSALQLLYNLPLVEGDQVEVVGGSDETYVIAGGNSELIDALAAALPGQIQLRKQLTQIRRQQSGFRLKFSDNTLVYADYVILAMPFSVLRKVDIQVPLPGVLKRFIQEAELSINDKLIAGFKERVWRQEEGFVSEAWTDFGFSEVWDESQQQPNRKEGALVFYFGGNPAKDLQTGRAIAQGREALRQLEEFIPGAQAAFNQKFARTSWTTDPFTLGGYSTFKPGQYTEFSEFLYVESEDPEERQDVAIGNLIFAGEQLSDEFYGFMNGAAQTGRLAADVLVRKLQDV